MVLVQEDSEKTIAKPATVIWEISLRNSCTEAEVVELLCHAVPRCRLNCQDGVYIILSRDDGGVVKSCWLPFQRRPGQSMPGRAQVRHIFLLQREKI